MHLLYVLIEFQKRVASAISTYVRISDHSNPTTPAPYVRA